MKLVPNHCCLDWKISIFVLHIMISPRNLESTLTLSTRS